MQGLKKLGILRLLDIPHFGHILEVNAYIKLLLSCVHGRNLCLDMKVEITTQLISEIIELPIQGEDLEHLFKKENEKVKVQEMYKKYGPTRVERGILISIINYYIVKFCTYFMACKLLRKCKNN